MKFTPGLLAAMTGIALFTCATASADDGPTSAPSGFEINPIGSLGITQGGDTLGTYRVEFLGETSDVDVDAGDSIFLYGGLEMRWPQAHVGMLVQGGFAGTGVGNSSDGVDFKRWPVEVIGFVEAGKFRLGLGAARHLGPTFDEDGIGNLRVEFDDANGWIAQFEYRTETAAIGFRYVDIDYEFETLTIGGEHLGVYGTYIFGSRGK